MKAFTLLIALFVFPTVSNAIPVIVGGTDYEIKWEIGTFDEVNLSRNLEDEPWWNNDELTSDFVVALGFRDDGDSGQLFGPIFAVTPRFIQSGPVLRGGTTHSSAGVILGDFNLTSSFAFAYTTEAASPVPLPAALGLLMLSLASLGATRRQR